MGFMNCIPATRFRLEEEKKGMREPSGGGACWWERVSQNWPSITSFAQLQQAIFGITMRMLIKILTFLKQFLCQVLGQAFYTHYFI